MKRLTALVLGVLGLAGLAGPAGAQYYPNPYYRPPMYAPAQGYYAPAMPYNPYYQPMRYYPATPMPQQRPMGMPYTSYSMPRPMPTGQQGPMVMQVMPPAPAPSQTSQVVNVPANNVETINNLPTSVEPMPQGSVSGQSTGMFKPFGQGHGHHSVVIQERQPCASCENGSCGSCATGSCEPSCEPCCEPCGAPCPYKIPDHRRKCGFYVDGQALYLQPRWQNNPAWVAGPDIFLVPDGTVTATQKDFEFDWQVSPRVEIGFSNDCGFGLRGRAFYFSQNAQESITRDTPDVSIRTAAPLGLAGFLGLGDTANLAAELTMYTGDVEFTHDLQAGRWALRMSVGGRFAHIEQNYQATAVTPAGAAAGGIYSGLEFDGGGPTVALEAHRRVGKTNWAGFGMIRTSLLYGTYDQNVTVSGPNAILPTQATKATEDFLPVLELEGGIEWVKPMKEMLIFCRAGFVAQTWFGACNSSDSSPNFFGGANSNSRSNLSFLGGMLTAGVQF